MTAPQTIAISGASGFVGGALAEALTARGREVVPMVRRRDQAGLYWNAVDGEIDREGLAAVQAVVHLAGESIAAGRWNAARKRRILDSRVKGTSLVARAIAELPAGDRPRVLVSASAVGIYGDRGDEALDEDSAPGEGFLADVCRQWERAADPARDATRVVHPRIGVVLARSGGALERMLPVFKLGAGGKLGSGRQWTSWISMDDVVGALVHLIDAALEGPVNVTAPTPVTNADFTRALGEAVRRPTFLPAPGFALKLALGEMADEMLLASTRALPKRLLDDGYVFRHPELPPALRAA